MNKTTSLILLILSLVAWTVFSTCYRANNCCGSVGDSNAGAAVVPMGENSYCGSWNVSDGDDFNESAENYLRFIKGESTVLKYGEQRENLLKGLASYLTEHTNRELIITGIYDESESYDGKLDNLGIARAESVRAILTALGVADEQISSESGLVEVKNAFYSDTLCHGVEFTFTGEPNISAEPVPTAASVCESLEGDGLILYFNFSAADDAKFSKKEMELLDALTECLNTIPGSNIRVEGHTDNTGSYEKNKKLSRSRARLIRSYLNNSGIKMDRISIEGYADDRPVADNGSEDGRALNRRVEIKLVK